MTVQWTGLAFPINQQVDDPVRGSLTLSTVRGEAKSNPPWSRKPQGWGPGRAIVMTTVCAIPGLGFPSSSSARRPPGGRQDGQQ